MPEVLGTGVVIFGADDCLAIKRRQARQARRHARATRQRIARMEQILAHLGVMTARELKDRHEQAGGDSFAWQRAAEILSAARGGKPLPQINWLELWDMLRWYAHNRGYFAPPWANRGEEEVLDDDEVPDSEKVEIGRARMRELGTTTMAETTAAYTAWYEREVARWQQKQRPDKPAHFKGLKAAFQRESVVWPEVAALLHALQGRLAKLDDDLIRTLLANDVDPLKDPDAWRTIACPAIKLPKRYHGGLLFGQSIPRFDNRIIGVCPIRFARLTSKYLGEGLESGEAKRCAEKESKLPSKASPEFLRFRWAMQLANIFGAAPGERDTRPLTAPERKLLTEQAGRQGAFTKGEFKKVVRAIAGWAEKGGRDNLDNLLLHPDAEKALELDPAQAAIAGSQLAASLGALPERYRKRLHGKLERGQSVRLADVRAWLEKADGPRVQPTASAPSVPDDLVAFDAGVQRVLDTAATRRSKKQSPLTREALLDEKLTAKYPKGRAPYSRPILREAFDEVMKGWDPRAEKNDHQPRGCLCQTNELKEAQLQRRLEEQTNNHLIRHRLLILERLQRDLIAAPEFANGDRARIAGITIEVNRDLRDLSSKTREEQKLDLGLRLSDFKRVAAKVEEACRRRNIPVTAGLIRKARVAEDLGWHCPYTGRQFNMDTLLDGVMDKDHIIPHADRQSDSLDSLVITWAEINKWKGKRTAMEFIRDEGGKPVPGLRGVEVMSLAEFQKHVAGLDIRKGHDDDRARKKRRIRRLLTEHYEEKEFTPRDLTVTSQLVRLGAQVLQRAFPPEQRAPVVSLPGSLTGEVRKAWKLLGCLGAANPAIFEADGKTPKRKDDIRGITHLHHALDACVLGLAALFFPRHGTVWSAMVKAGGDREADEDRRLWLAMTKRRPTAAEAALLKATGLYRQDSEGRLHLSDLPDALKQQIRSRLAEKRVVQHIPADMSGVKIEENTRGVVGEKDGRVLLRQRSARDAKTGLQTVKRTGEAPGKLLGLNPTGSDGKLKRQKGARVITDNFGVAILDHALGGEEFAVIPWHRVWHRLQALKAMNGGEPPRILRNGMLIKVAAGTYQGLWRVISAKDTQAYGKVVDLALPDGQALERGNAPLRKLLVDGLEILAQKSFVGHSTAGVAYAAKRTRKTKSP